MKRNHLIFVLACLAGSLISQSNRYAFLSYVFPSDSLSGFNDEKVKLEALSRGFFGIEYEVFIYRAKRNFINAKYGNDNTGTNKYELSVVANSAPCVNEDFEASPAGTVSAISGWTLTEGSNSASCTMAGCCPNAASGNNTWIRTTPYNTASLIGTIPNSPLGGTKVLQMNDNITNLGEVVRLSQMISVSTSNSIFQYAYMCQMDGSGHFCCDNPYFNVLFYDCSNNLIPSMTMSVLPSYSCGLTPNPNWTSTTGGIFYHTGWQVVSVNLGAYLGSCVKVEVTVGDCDGWAHPGFCFFDAKCSASTGTSEAESETNRLKIYPNPNSGKFVIESTTEEVVFILNELGQTLRNIKLCPANNYSVAINNLAVGIYIVSGKQFKKKIVVTE